jgi:hypothetical protein
MAWKALVHRFITIWKPGRIGESPQGQVDAVVNFDGRRQASVQQFHCFLRDDSYLQRRLLALPLAAEIENLSHQISCTVAGHDDLVYVFPPVAIRGHRIEGQLGVAAHGAQDIVEIVSNAPGQGADCFHLLRLKELRLQLLAFA